MRFRLLFMLALFASSSLWLGATPSSLGASVVVFPLTVNGDAEKDSGNRLAVLIAQQMAENGVKVTAPPPGTQRKDFLDVARQLGCEYYVAGFITPLGREVTVVEQVVSTISGTVVYSTSAQLLTYADASGQGALLAGAVLRHAGRGLASLGEAPNAATPAPKESNEANLTGIFKRKPKAKPSPSASPAAATVAQAAPPKPAPTTQTRAPEPVRTAAPVTPAPVPPSRSVPTPAAAVTVAAAGPAGRVVLFEFGGPAASDRRAFARQALETRLLKSGQNVARAGAVDPAEVVKRAADLCAQNSAKALVDAQLATRDGDQTYGPNTVAAIDVRAVDCSGRVVFQQHFERDGTGRKNWERAIDSAAAAAVSPLDRAIR